RDAILESRMRLHAWYSDHLAFPLPEGHRFPLAKYAAFRRLLLERGVLAPHEISPAPLATDDELLAAHDLAYLHAVVHGALDARELRRIGLPWSEALVARSRASVGGTLAAARHALAHGLGGNLAGGTHHAFAGAGAGYCVFNDIAVAIRALQREGRIRRALVVDLDVHQGDGTAAIFAGDGDVFTFSMHGARNFPFRKMRSHLDVELEDGTGDEAYLALLRDHLPLVIERAQPEIVFYQAGVDPLAADRLGRMRLSFEGLAARDAFVLGMAKRAGVPVVLTMGGGYAEPIEHTVEAHVGTWREARRLFG